MALPAAGPIDIDRVIDGHKLSGLQIRVFILCAFVVLLDGYDLQSMALAVPSISAAWSLAPKSFGVALSASLVGYGLGSIFVAPLGDRLGRRPVLIGSLALMGVASIMTGLATGLWQLALWRVLTGVGLGSCQANGWALTAEYAPRARRASLMTLMGCNVSVGATLAGLSGPEVIGAMGWPGVFFVGGVLPLVLCLVLIPALPESVRLLTVLRPRDPRISRILGKIAPDLTEFPVRREPAPVVERQSLLVLLRPPYTKRTMLLWSLYSLNTFVLYLLVSWLPTLLAGAGWRPADALRGSGVLQMGGVAGGLLLSRLIDRGWVLPALLATSAVAMGAALLFLVVPPTVLGWSILLAFMGSGVSGGSLAILSLGAIFYPTPIRATGLGGATAASRIGAVIGPLAAATVMGWGVGSAGIMALLAIPNIVGAATALILPRILRSIEKTG